jgi:hypothetical protein
MLLIGFCKQAFANRAAAKLVRGSAEVERLIQASIV